MRRTKSALSTMIAVAMTVSLASVITPESGAPPTCMTYAEALAADRPPDEPKNGVFRDLWRWIWGEPLPPATPRYKGYIVCAGSEG